MFKTDTTLKTMDHLVQLVDPGSSEPLKGKPAEQCWKMLTTLCALPPYGLQPPTRSVRRSPTRGAAPCAGAQEAYFTMMGREAAQPLAEKVCVLCWAALRWDGASASEGGAAASPRLVSADYPRRGHSGAATRRSTSARAERPPRASQSRRPRAAGRPRRCSASACSRRAAGAPRDRPRAHLSPPSRSPPRTRDVRIVRAVVPSIARESNESRRARRRIARTRNQLAPCREPCIRDRRWTSR